MKKLFISEKDMPISCNGCVCYDGENGRCKVLDTYLEGEHIPRICPLQSLEQHDNEVRREFAEKVKETLCTGSIAFNDIIIRRIDDLLQYEVEE